MRRIQLSESYLEEVEKMTVIFPVIGVTTTLSIVLLDLAKIIYIYEGSERKAMAEP